MLDYSQQSRNPLKKLPYNLRCELASFVSRSSRPSPELCRVSDTRSDYGKASARELAFDFARAAVAKLNLPYDIKNYLDKAAAARLKKHGLKRAVSFIDTRSAQVAATFAQLPEPWYRVDTEYKRVRLADELAGRARLHLNLARHAGKSPLEALEEINEFTGLALWIPHFEPSSCDDDTVYFSIIARALDDAVWLRSINKRVTIAFESARRAAGMVSPHVSPYASFSACQWLKDRRKKQLDWLESMAIESECGESLDLKDAHDASTSNPANRRNELMTQLRGCQEYADANEHVALFGTLTAAGCYHRLKKHGKYFIENKHWNGQAPQAAHKWISTSWQRFRSAADKAGVIYYGMRVVEPHVDGTPHWHAVFFVPRSHVDAFIKLLTFYQHQRNRDELFCADGKPKYSAMKARCKIDEIDRSKGDAVSYIAKYISKNIDAHKLEGKKDLDSSLVDLTSSVLNVTAWSRAFCFRQFQFQKTPSVTVWRELRRIKEEQEFGLFEKIRLAADCGCFASFFNWMGGHHVKQRNRPISIHYDVAENCYEEAVKKTAGVDGAGMTILTREKQWKLVKKKTQPRDLNALAAGLLESAESGGSRFPWTSVNNCTQPPDIHESPDLFWSDPYRYGAQSPDIPAPVASSAPTKPKIVKKAVKKGGRLTKYAAQKYKG